MPDFLYGAGFGAGYVWLSDSRSLKHTAAAATMCFLIASVVLFASVGPVAMRVHFPPRWPLVFSIAGRISLCSDMSFAGAEHFLSMSRLSVLQ